MTQSMTCFQLAVNDRSVKEASDNFSEKFSNALSIDVTTNQRKLVKMLSHLNEIAKGGYTD